jgi:CRP/FNR family cyclic AMP-dependent transcriptional regulator
MVNIHHFRNYPIFKNLNDSELEKIHTIMSFKTYDKGVQIIKDGDKGDRTFILIKGEVEISKPLTLIHSESGEVGKADKALIRLKEEFYPCVGEMVLFGDDSVRSATVTTTKKSEFAIIKKDDFLELAEKNNSIGYKVMKNLAEIIGDRLKKANQDILKLTTAFSLALER